MNGERNRTNEDDLVADHHRPRNEKKGVLKVILRQIAENRNLPANRLSICLRGSVETAAVQTVVLL